MRLKSFNSIKLNEKQEAYMDGHLNICPRDIGIATAELLADLPEKYEYLADALICFSTDLTRKLFPMKTND